MLEGFRERVQTLHLTRPLLDLQRSKSFEEYDLVALGLATLLFVLENMLGSPGDPCGHAEISRFLRRTIKETYGDDPGQEKAEAVEEYLLERLRNNGRKFSYPYLNLATRQREEVSFQLITLQSYRPDNRRVTFKLTEHGLELIFRTREMNRELRVGIYQLYLRQQLERGTFDGALEVLDTLKLEVRSQRERLESFVYQVHHNLREVLPEQYRQQYERTKRVLQDEQRQFEHLHDMIESERQNRENIVAPTEVDLAALRQLKQIETELNRVSSEHSQLLARRMRVDNLLMNEIRAELQKGFRVRFRPEDELLKPMLPNPAFPAGRVKAAVESLLPVHLPAYFNPLRAMRRQVLWSSPEAASYRIEPVREGEILDSESEKQSRTRCIHYLRMIARQALQGGSFSLRDLMNIQSENEQKSMWRCRDFYQLMMALHQEKELDIEGIMAQRDDWLNSGDMPVPYLVSRALQDLDALPPSLEVTAGDEIVRFPNGNYISNLVFSPAKGDDDAERISSDGDQ